MRITFLLALMLCGISQAGILQSFYLDTSVNNLATTYSTTLVYEPFKVLKGVVQVCVNNPSASLIAINVDAPLSTAAPSVDVNDLYIPGGSSACIYIDRRQKTNLYLRSASGSAITTGLIFGYAADVAYGKVGS